ncbi:hypothetical protein [Hymenobacter fastidiosus]|uniref:hypothetical protein n=1 Tax=Hymenobacter fastidiosus TaxID=486264 RepID=UPI0031EC35C4
MKSYLRFFILFALIIVGRMVKQPAPATAAKAVPPANQTQNASFFVRQANLERLSTVSGSGSRLWQATAPSTRTAVSLE